MNYRKALDRVLALDYWASPDQIGEAIYGTEDEYSEAPYQADMIHLFIMLKLLNTSTPKE